MPLTASLSDVPAYPDVPTYLNILGSLHVWEGDGWKKESMSWKEGAYIGSNLSGIPEMTFRGPDAQEFLSRLSINNVHTWPLGKSKHLVMLDDDGYIANHGLAVRDGEESFRLFASMPWPLYKLPTMGLNVDVALRDIFIFQVAGPQSLAVLEELTGTPLRSLAFLGIQTIEVPGTDASVEIELSRIGMSGTLAYEVRGPLEYGPAVFDAVYKAGRAFDITRLGWRTYVVNHTEGGFPQQGCTFLPAAFKDPGFVSHPMFGATLPPHQVNGQLSGSAESADITKRLRTPFEVNWGWMAKFDHDFIGRAALEAEAASPRRKTVVLKWNKDDVLDVFASQFEPGEEYRNFEFPTTPQSPAGDHADIVTKDGVEVGISSLAVYSYYYREMLSHSTMDVGLAEIGTEVVLHWGHHGERVKQIRATVERFPYLDLPANKDIDLVSAGTTVVGSSISAEA
ncbi:MULTISPECIES: aminomethyltransferase family protein [unclassified Rhodococcus (in: high G+C Gram-positive bacteria)]|uniref:aminomethyltransferase family protein n=1 Tax=unclassified Rhodococcus (in: high G+C Gram-positive bacteria) TaxID=192944 RepID=UPI0006FBFF3F|nr:MULTISPECIES: aminomethyltransferase family protein [unclassified Rhodococcus (in: high G+C Gram-positive bacteria)]KQU38417.1 aminomethyltransferase [Rhodococcus sp. Leaf225]KQU39780.1 aminomethyltransferase [Rhodococcus sp. Leaf258]